MITTVQNMMWLIDFSNSKDYAKNLIKLEHFLNFCEEKAEVYPIVNATILSYDSLDTDLQKRLGRIVSNSRKKGIVINLKDADSIKAERLLEKLRNEAERAS